MTLQRALELKKKKKKSKEQNIGKTEKPKRGENKL